MFSFWEVVIPSEKKSKTFPGPELSLPENRSEYSSRLRDITAQTQNYY